MPSLSPGRIARFAKYGIAARALAPIVRRTSFLDGTDAPPPAINFAGGGDFKAIGEEQTRILVERAGLCASDRVLDVGCGIGRVALRVAQRFPDLSYDGFDVVAYGIIWTQKKLARNQGFDFVHADIYNSFYNPRGRIHPESYRFPYPDGRHDLVFATSVFTHLLESTARTYFHEAARVMAAGGRLYFSTFLTDGALGSKPAHRFRHPDGCAWVASLSEPELAVAYPLSFWLDLAAATKLTHSATFWGSWRGIEGGQDFQDALLFVKQE